MTFQEYVNNPTGAKTAVMSYRKMYEDLYHDKWSKIMTRENGHIDYKLYTAKNDYYCYLKIPSESCDDFYYDVVIKFNDAKGKTLHDAQVQFFSNDPSFNYTFAHAFKKHKLTIHELESKMSKVALTHLAKEKNPDDVIGYVKSLYFAYIVMVDKGLFHTIKYKMEGQKFDKKLIMADIMDTEDKIRERTEAGRSAIKKDKPAKTPERKNLIHPEVKNGGVLGNNIRKVGLIGSNHKSIGKFQNKINSRYNNRIGKFNGRYSK